MLTGITFREARNRILIVDDKHLATHVLGRLLRRNGYVAAEENDPAKALQVAHRFQPDVILLDVHMPWKNGYELAADFAADDRLSRVPIIFMTGEAQERDPRAGSHPILFKPFSIEELFALVKKALCGKWEDRSAVSAQREDLTESDVI